MRTQGLNSSLSQIPKKPLPFSHPGLLYGFSNRQSGNMSLCYGDTTNALKNRRDFLQGLNIDYRSLVCAKQVHGDRVRYVLEEDRGKGVLIYENSIADTDAFITDKKNLPLAIFTADCLSVFLYDQNTPAIGLVHAGRRSTQQEITAKVVELMQEKFGTDTQFLYALFGPGIKSCCYEVDLSAENKKQLLSLSLKAEHIFDCAVCTSCQNQEFFSYRREGPSCGRMISVISL